MSAPHAPTTPTVAAVTSFLEKFYKELGKAFFWLTVVIMALAVLRVMQYPAAIPMGLAAVAVLANYSRVWGSSATGRRMAMYAATFILLLTIAAFLLPLNYIKTIPSRDEIGEKLVEKGLLGGAWDGVKTLAFGKSAESADSNVSPEGEELLLLRFECYTPCSGSIDWPYKFTFDYTLNVKHPGIENIVTYYPKGNKEAPSGLLKGETFFTSGDPDKQNFKVQVFERIRR